MSKETRYFSDFRAGEIVRPNQPGQASTPMHHEMTPSSQIPQPTEKYPIRQIMQEIAYKHQNMVKQPDMTIDGQSIQEEQTFFDANPHKKQTEAKAKQRQTVQDIETTAQQQEKLKNASDKMRARSATDRPQSELISISEMMERDNAMAAEKSAKQKSKTPKPNGTKTKTIQPTDETSADKSLKRNSVSPVSEFDPWKNDIQTAIQPIQQKQNTTSKVVQQPAHFNMNRADRIAAAEAKLGERIAKIQKNEKEKE